MLNNKELRVFKQLVALSQTQLFEAMVNILKNKYTNIIVTKHYIYAIGDIPILLTAHLDTVFPSPAKTVYYDTDKNVMWSPDGLGADDRSGVFMILKLLSTKLRPSIVFTTDEEKGGFGAQSLVETMTKPLGQLDYIIGLDRQGFQDCVFYDCNNPSFTKYVESFGFTTQLGSFSDISIICPRWGIAGVNLSVGYQNEHSYLETFHIDAFNDTLRKVTKMLQSTAGTKFEYIPSRRWEKEKTGTELMLKCNRCSKKFAEYELIPIGKDKNIKWYCSDCVLE